MPKKIKTHAETILHQNLPIIEVAEPWLLDTMLADAGAARWIVTRLSASSGTRPSCWRNSV
jgi:hypothetical protein